MTTTFVQPINNYATTLAIAHNAGGVTLALSTSPGTLAAGRIWRVTALANPNTDTESVLAIFEATANTGPLLTGVTAVEGTTNVALSSGTPIEIRMTAKDLSEVQDALNAAEAAIATLNSSAVTALTGDVTAAGPGSAAATVAAIQGRGVATTAPVDGYLLTWVASTSKWTPRVAGVSSSNWQFGTSYRLVLTDAGRFLIFSNSSPITLTIPLHSSVPLPTDTQIDLTQFDVGQVTIAMDGGVTLFSYAGKVSLAGRYAAATLKQVAMDEWILIGNLA